MRPEGELHVQGRGDRVVASPEPAAGVLRREGQREVRPEGIRARMVGEHGEAAIRSRVRQIHPVEDDVVADGAPVAEPGVVEPARADVERRVLEEPAVPDDGGEQHVELIAVVGEAATRLLAPAARMRKFADAGILVPIDMERAGDRGIVRRQRVDLRERRPGDLAAHGDGEPRRVRARNRTDCRLLAGGTPAIELVEVAAEFAEKAVGVRRHRVGGEGRAVACEGYGSKTSSRVPLETVRRPSAPFRAVQTAWPCAAARAAVRV